MHDPNSTQNINIVEVGPRDGLQNETATVPTDAKVAFVDALSATGVSEIEVSAFVSPGRVPQLADAHEVFRNISRKPGNEQLQLERRFAALTRLPNAVTMWDWAVAHGGRGVWAA